MKVSMDGLRRRLIADYNSLTRKLNKSIKDKSFDPEIIIDPEEIRDEMDRLRTGLITLAFIYMEGEFESLDENTHFEEFEELNIEKD
jgi:hypothetical protein